MTSVRKREANKRNAQLSTGPKNTDVTRFNAVTHGIFTSQAYLESGSSEEERELFEALRDGLYADLAPVGTVEAMLVDDILKCAWSLRAVAGFEQALRGAKQDKAESGNGLNERRKLKSRLKIAEQRLRAFETPDTLTDEQEAVDWLFTLLEGAWGVDVKGTLQLEVEWSAYANFGERDIKLAVNAARHKRGLLEREVWEEVRLAAERERDDVAGQLERLQRGRPRRRMIAGFLQPSFWDLIVRYDTHYSRRFYQAIRELDRAKASRRSQGQASPEPIKVDFRAAGRERPA